MNEDEETKVIEVVLIGIAVFILLTLFLIGIALIAIAFMKVY